MLLALMFAACQPPPTSAPVLLVVSAQDEALLTRAAEIESVFREAAKGHLTLVPADVAARAMRAEGGREQREASLVKARVLLRRAEERFRELDDEQALELIAKATANLAAVHQEEGAIELLARAHLLAGAIYLARDRIAAARNRLQRTLDLDPDIAPARQRFAPRVLSELAALRAGQSARPVGRLEVQLINRGLVARVFIDGRARGATPLTLDAIGEGRHLIRVTAPGYQSFVRSVSITGGRGHVERVNLVRDREIAVIAALPRTLRAGKNPAKTLALLARRAGAERGVLAVTRLSGRRTAVGTPALGLEIVVPGAGRSYAPAADAASVRAALERAMRCDSGGPKPERLAPIMFGPGDVEASTPAPVRPPAPWWHGPWFWGTAAAITLVVAGSFVVARTAGGPPEAVQIRLIPRP